MATVAADVEGQAVRPTSAKLTLLPLIALIIGSMIGGGVFNLPSDMSKAAAPGAIIIGWLITGIGMLMLAFVYQSLATRKPDLNAGPYAYAKAGFGDFVGFNAAWGYWLSAFLGNVAYSVAIFSALPTSCPPSPVAWIRPTTVTPTISMASLAGTARSMPSAIRASASTSLAAMTCRRLAIPAIRWAERSCRPSMATAPNSTAR